jgi:hypothetical protein
MPNLSAKSKEKLATVHPDLQKVLLAAIEFTDFTILEGHRTPERQRRLFAANKTKIDGVTKKGKHNFFPSLAVDIAPYPIDFNDAQRYHVLASIILRVAKSLDVEIRWGGDWDRDGILTDQKFIDIGHFELWGKQYERQSAA